MKTRELINKGLSALLTITFLAVVRPDPMPSMWAVGIVAILLFEGLAWSIRYIRRVRRKEAIRRNTEAMYYDGKRWAEEKIRWPMYEEVS